MRPRPPRSTRTDTPLPYTPLFRSSSRPSCGSPCHLHREADHRESVIRQLIEPVQFLHLIIAANASCLVALPYDLRVAFRGVAPGRMREGSVPGPRIGPHDPDALPGQKEHRLLSHATSFVQEIGASIGRSEEHTSELQS